MRRRTKKRLMIAGAILVIGFGLFRTYGPKDERPKLAAFSNQWAVEDVNWSELFDKQAVSFNLALVDGTGEVQISDDSLTGFCEKVLNALPTPPAPDLTAKDVYRIAFNVNNQREMFYEDDIASTVADGACLVDPKEAAPYRYPARLTDWVLRDNADETYRDLKVLEASFTWSGSGDMDVKDFSFDQACIALLNDPPCAMTETFRNFQWGGV